MYGKLSVIMYVDFDAVEFAVAAVAHYELKHVFAVVFSKDVVGDFVGFLAFFKFRYFCLYGVERFAIPENDTHGEHRVVFFEAFTFG